MSEQISPRQALYERLSAQQDAAIEAGDDAAADALCKEVGRALEDWYTHDPPPDVLLERAAAKSEAVADWTGAETCYRQLIVLHANTPFKAFESHLKLGKLYQLLRHEDEAVNQFSLATLAAGQMELTTALAIARYAEASCLVAFDRMAQAGQLILETMAELDNGTLFNTLRAKLLLIGAQCALHNGRFADTESNLQWVYELLWDWAEEVHPVSIEMELAIWWTITAKLRGKRGDHAGAIAAWQQALSIHRGLAASDDCYDTVYHKATIADMLKGLAEALLAGGHPHEAEACVIEHSEILKVAGLAHRI